MKKAILIHLALLFTIVSSGCAILPEPDASPTEVVEKFASFHRDKMFEACYILMSTEYKNSTKESIFKEKIRHCNPSWTRYEFVEVINGSEKIEGDLASLDIIYLEKYNDQSLGDFNPLVKLSEKRKTKTINLIKEKDGWKFTELYCELKK